MADPVFDFSSKTVLKTAHNTKIEAKLLQKEWKEPRLEKELWHGKKRSRVFWVWLVPLIIQVQPKFDLFLDGSLSANAELEYAVQTENTYTCVVSYSRKSGWGVDRNEDSSRKAQPGGVSAELKSQLNAGVEFGVEVTFNLLYVVKPSIDVGGYVEIETKTNPFGVAFPPLAIHLEKFEIGSVLRLKITGRLSFQKAETNFAIFQIPLFRLISLPKPKLVALPSQICQGSDAYAITVQLEEDTPGKGIEMVPPYNFVAGNWPADSLWVLTHQQELSPQVTVSFPRAAMASLEDSVEYPFNFDLYSQADIFPIPTPFFFALLMHTQDLQGLLVENPLPQNSQCCDDADCNVGRWFGSGLTCRNFQCVEPTTAPTRTPTEVPPTPPTRTPAEVPITPTPIAPTNEVKSNRGFSGKYMKLQEFQCLFNALTSLSFTADPHFETWNGWRSYQGACDLVYLQSSWIRIHIRTTLAQSGFFPISRKWQYRSVATSLKSATTEATL